MIEGKVIYSFQKNSLDNVKVRVMEFHGRKVFDIRVFVERLNGEFTPTRKGIMLDVNDFEKFEKCVAALKKEFDENNKADSKKLSSV
jgi:hypothetical protein